MGIQRSRMILRRIRCLNRRVLADAAREDDRVHAVALGEYLFVQCARELLANELAIEEWQLAESPDAEVTELRDIYERKGVPSPMARDLAEHMVRSDPRLALDTMAREELGFDPDELGGSAWVAAGTSMSLFALGALVRSRTLCRQLAISATAAQRVTKPAKGRPPGPPFSSPITMDRRPCRIRRDRLGLCFILIPLPSPTPLLLAALRALIGGGVLAGWVALRSRGASSLRGATTQACVALWRAGLPSAPLLLVLALTNAALAFGAMHLAAGRAEAAVASILTGGQPLVLAAAGWALFGERVSVRNVAGLAVAMVGVVFVATTSSGATSPDSVALALFAGAAPAAETVLMRRLASSVDLLVPR